MLEGKASTLVLANGWTKERVLAQVKRYNNGKKATVGKRCAYLTLTGNRCFIGAFIPSWTLALLSTDAVFLLVERNPELLPLMPFEVPGLVRFQEAHDRAESSTIKALERFLAEEVA